MLLFKVYLFEKICAQTCINLETLVKKYVLKFEFKIFKNGVRQNYCYSFSFLTAS